MISTDLISSVYSSNNVEQNYATQTQPKEGFSQAFNDSIDELNSNDNNELTNTSEVATLPQNPNSTIENIAQYSAISSNSSNSSVAETADSTIISQSSDASAISSQTTNTAINFATINSIVNEEFTQFQGIDLSAVQNELIASTLQPANSEQSNINSILIANTSETSAVAVSGDSISSELLALSSIVGVEGKGTLIENNSQAVNTQQKSSATNLLNTLLSPIQSIEQQTTAQTTATTATPQSEIINSLGLQSISITTSNNPSTQSKTTTIKTDTGISSNSTTNASATIDNLISAINADSTSNSGQQSSGESTYDSNFFKNLFNPTEAKTKANNTDSTIGNSSLNLASNTSLDTTSQSITSYNQVTLDELVEKISQATSATENNTTSTARMVLQPESLGVVFVEISMTNNVAKLKINAESTEAVKMLESQIEALSNKLTEQGIKTESIEINLKNSEENLNNSSYEWQNKQNSQEDKDTQQAFVQSFNNLQDEAIETADYAGINYN